jgi:hypothetical protein
MLAMAGSSMPAAVDRHDAISVIDIMIGKLPSEDDAESIGGGTR